MKHSTAWTKKDLEYLFQAKAEGLPYSVIARELGRTVESVKSKFLKTDWDKTGVIDSVSKRMKNSKKVLFEQKTASTLERKLETYKLRADLIADRVEKSIKAAPKVKHKTWNPPGRKRQKHKNEDIGLILSDLHIGHHHSLEETGGLSEYSIDTFIKRLKNLEIATADIFELHSTLYKIPTLHIFCLGDIVDGMNNAGAWSPVYIETPIFDQIMTAMEHVSASIAFWLSMFKEIKFYGIRGNHGRVAPSGAEKDYNNWDVLFYKMLELKFADNPRIKFIVPKTWWHMEEIKGHKFLMVHGDDVRSSGSAIKGLENFEQKMTGIMKKIPDYTIMGHFHSCAEFSTNSGKLICNGSFVGGDVYSLKTIHRASKSEQKMFGIHDKRGITWTYNIDLESKR